MKKAVKFLVKAVFLLLPWFLVAVLLQLVTGYVIWIMSVTVAKDMSSDEYYKQVDKKQRYKDIKEASAKIVRRAQKGKKWIWKFD